jgi:hypothetical protein
VAGVPGGRKGHFYRHFAVLAEILSEMTASKLLSTIRTSGKRPGKVAVGGFLEKNHQ